MLSYCCSLYVYTCTCNYNNKNILFVNQNFTMNATEILLESLP